ncbi:MAG: hypothetical protein V7L13_15215 [Nostoc sp.]|uniref:sacsin N-terminal ATP-binding-like domain-containing protein n=1 Tax=Nostoc sp. TaxID=1180 RepID=UPI002FF50713
MPSNYSEIKQHNVIDYGRKFEKIGEFLAKKLYNDQTHFIYELLQNTEDALSRQNQNDPNSKLPKSITFRLYSDHLEVSHFGKSFDEADVRGICNILEGTKQEDEKQIGKFGIGFKSVYAFTSSPEIYSGSEHFKIEEYIYPCSINPRELLPGETVFIFPFNHKSELPKNTFHRILNKLDSLKPSILLFLCNIEEISWNVEEGSTITYRREMQPIAPNCRKVILIGKDRQEWLVFDKPVEGHSNLKIEIAFLLGKDKQTGKEQIISVGSSPLVVFLPTEIETNLQFLVQGPYHTTPARDNIRRDNIFNQSLIDHTAALVAEVLPLIRDMGLLTVNTLNVLPIRKSDFEKNPIFSPVFEEVRQAFREKALLPTIRDGQYVPARQAKLARSKDFRQLLSETQLQQLYGSTYTWLSDEITQGRTPDIHKYITEELDVQEIEPEDFARKFNELFIEQQSDGWVASFYAFLNKQEALWRAGDGILRNKPFIRLQDATHVEPFRSDRLPNAYLSLSSGDKTDFPTVKREIVENKLVGRNSLMFLIQLGLSEPDVVAEVMEKIIPKYQKSNVHQIDKGEHEHDIDKILRALKSVFASGNKSKTDIVTKKEQLVTKLKETPFLRAINAGEGRQAYKHPRDIYFWSSDLELYFKGNPSAWFLNDTCNEQDHYYLEIIGVSKKVKVFCKKPDAAGSIIISSSKGNHQRGLNGFDPKCEIDGLKYALENPTYGKAIYIWNELLLHNVQHIYGEIQVASNKDFKNPQLPIKQVSIIGNLARKTAWLPDKNGNFYKPCDLPVDALTEDFMLKANLANRLGMKLKSSEDLTKKLNEEYKQVLGGKKVTQEYIDFVLRNIETIEKLRMKGLIFRSKSEEDSENEGNAQSVESINFRKELIQTFTQLGSIELDRDNELLTANPSNPERYLKGAEANIISNQENEPPVQERFKKVPTKKWESKNNEVRIFLKEEYKGKCQICDYTFPKRNSQPYFEGLYLVSQTRARWIDDRGNVLCLCANCCAKFKQGSIGAEDILEQIEEEVEKSNPVLHIQLCGEDVNIRFSKKHIIYLQALLNASSQNDSH